MSGGGGSVTVGYRYYMGLHIGVCLGPVDALLELHAGDRQAWAGSVAASGSITINAAQLFGGEGKEGGLQGTLDVMMGEATQNPNGYLMARQDGPQPAYRGLLGLVFRQGLIACNNPYIKPWKLKLRRILKGWQDDATAWYAEKAEITLSSGDKAANPAHIVYECLTNGDWGMGGPVAQIDDANFRAAADTFHAEGMGLCIQWLRQDQIDNFVARVLMHCGAVLNQNPRTGLFQLQPIRGGYDAETLPTFGPSEIESLEGFERPSPAEATNEVIVAFNDVAGGRRSSVTVQNLASIQSQGGVISVTKQYPGIPTADLATRVALRDMAAVSAPLARGKLRINRKAYPLMPGSLFRLNWPKLGIVNLVLRVLAVDAGTLTEGAISIEAAEDVFSLPSSSYVKQQPGGWVDPVQPPAAATVRKVFEAPWFELQRTLSAADLAVLADDAGYLATAIGRPSGDALNFRIYTRPGSSGAFAETGRGDFAPFAQLQNKIDAAATSATLTSMIDADIVKVGTYALVDAEAVRIDAFNPTTGAVTIGRGLLDTVAAPHSAGAAVVFADGFTETDSVERVDGDLVQTKVLPITGRGMLAEGLAPVDAVTFDQRHARPYPPGRMRINALAYPIAVFDSLTVSWAHRNRLQQNLEGDETGSIGPEAGTTYSVELARASDGSIAASGTTAGTSWAAPGTLTTDDYIVRVSSLRGGLASRQRHEHAVTFIAADSYGWNQLWGMSWGGASGAEINLRSVFEVEPRIPATGSKATIWRFIRADGYYIDVDHVSTGSGSSYTVRLRDTGDDVVDQLFAWRVGSASWDASTQRLALSVYANPSDPWERTPAVLIIDGSGSTLDVEHEIAPTFSAAPSGTEIMQVAAAAGAVFVRNYSGSDLQKFSISTGALQAARSDAPGTFGVSAATNLAADLTSVAIFYSGIVTLWNASDLADQDDFASGGTYNFLSSIALLGGDVLVTTEERMRRFTKAGSLIDSYPPATTAPSIAQGSIQQFGRYVAVPADGGGRVGFDTLNSWAVVADASYIPP